MKLIFIEFDPSTHKQPKQSIVEEDSSESNSDEEKQIENKNFSKMRLYL